MEPKRTILVVDDAPMFREIESLFLCRYGRVVTAASGAEALEAVRREQPDVVVLDFHLPDIDSETLCRRIMEAALKTTPADNVTIAVVRLVAGGTDAGAGAGHTGEGNR